MKAKLIVVILIFAAILRFVGDYPGYHPNHADEVNFQSQTVNMLKTGSLEELRFEYPPLPAYINYIFSKAVFIPLGFYKYYLSNIPQIFDQTVPLNPTPLAYNKLLQDEVFGDREINVLFWIRTVTALFGIGIVYLNYLISKRLFNTNVGLISAFFVAINYRQVLNSHFGLPDIYNAFFLLLAFFFVIKVWEKPTFKNYFIAAVFCGLSFATKYQFFSFIAFGLVHLYNSLNQRDTKGRLAFLFNPSIFIVPFVIAVIFMALNPYFFIRFESARDELTYAALKYRIGKNFLDFYPLSYLYHYGIGQVTSILILLGIPVIFFKDFKKGLLIMSIVAPFFYLMIYATGGGFYTRNFITITPFILILSAYLIEKLLIIKPKYFTYFLFLIVIIFAGYENLSKDWIVLANYTKPWNQEVIFDWVKNNIPKGSTIAAHSSVPLPDYYFTRVDFDTYPAFSLEEFNEEKAQYAIANYEWATNDFYWWMTVDMKDLSAYWNKPIEVMKKSYKAMSLLEMEDFGVKSFVKPGLAPEAAFLISKVPSYTVKNKNLVLTYNFTTGINGWKKSGGDLYWKDGLVIPKEGTGAPFVEWISPRIPVGDKAYVIDYSMLTAQDTDLKREGYIYVVFYNSEKEIGVRLSKRNDIYDKEIEDSLIAESPQGADSMQIGFGVYNPALANITLKNIKIYSAKISNTNGEGITHINIDENVLFPISHGNL